MLRLHHLFFDGITLSDRFCLVLRQALEKAEMLFSWSGIVLPSRRIFRRKDGE
ncbi:hypothetical protein HMPREF3039_02578 [Akkermansia sp. KLE1798]|nr:hypothetical protein HMPREF3039_02578 [Akkermansia sp. KLE1798]